MNSIYLVIGVGIVYAVIAVNQFIKGNTSMGITFAGYAFSNVGLAMAVK